MFLCLKIPLLRLAAPKFFFGAIKVHFSMIYVIKKSIGVANRHLYLSFADRRVYSTAYQSQHRFHLCFETSQLSTFVTVSSALPRAVQRVKRAGVSLGNLIPMIFHPKCSVGPSIRPIYTRSCFTMTIMIQACSNFIEPEYSYEIDGP